MFLFFIQRLFPKESVSGLEKRIILDLKPVVRRSVYSCEETHTQLMACNELFHVQ